MDIISRNQEYIIPWGFFTIKVKVTQSCWGKKPRTSLGRYASCFWSIFKKHCFSKTAFDTRYWFLKPFSETIYREICNPSVFLMFLRKNCLFQTFLCTVSEESKKNMQPGFSGSFDGIFKNSWSLKLGIFWKVVGELCESATYIASKSWTVENSALWRGKRHNS